ncbi:CASP-like protein 4D1 [Apium graveolens]|uniref:CASP-like protein 4D1 n=1 Tax=Apium graveolens TaxID=4045 RepID=UPI003D7A1DC6
MTTPPPSSIMPPPSTAVVWRSVGLVLRVLTVICLVISLIIITTNTATLPSNFGQIKIRFQDVKAYRYVLATIVIGLVYGFLQTAFAIYHVTSGNRINGGDALYFFDFYGDKLISYLLATGTGAGFGVTVDLKDANSVSALDKFFNKASAASSILLLAFIFMAISSILSSLSLPKRA